MPSATGRPLPTIDPLHYVSNIAWRATDVRNRHEVRPEIKDQSYGVVSVAGSSNPFVALTHKFDQHLQMRPENIDSASVQFMERAKRRAEHMRDHLVLGDDEQRMNYMLDGMGILDHNLDEVAEAKAMRQGRQFEDVRFESMREGTRLKNAYVVGLEELTHPGSMRNLDARLEGVAAHVDAVYEKFGREMPDEVRAAKYQMREAKCVDRLARESAGLSVEAQNQPSAGGRWTSHEVKNQDADPRRAPVKLPKTELEMQLAALLKDPPGSSSRVESPDLPSW